jgi:hypothetical protein
MVTRDSKHDCGMNDGHDDGHSESNEKKKEVVERKRHHNKAEQGIDYRKTND